MRIVKTVLPALLFALLALSCRKADNGAKRDDYIRVYASADGDTPLERAFVSVKGGKYTYYVRSNVDFTAKWQSEEDSWASISEPRKLDGNLWSIDIDVKPSAVRKTVPAAESPSGMYSHRYGVLMLSCQDKYLGNFFVVEQGFESRIACDFSWLFGSDDPNATYNDMLMDKWTQAQLNQGFKSIPLEGQEHAWVYSKEGYIKLGNDKGTGANLVLPRASDFQFDTLLVLSFKAVVQNGDVLPDYNGGTEPIVPMDGRARLASGSAKTDAASLSVEVSGGGFIRDLEGEAGRKISFTDLPTYNRESESFPGNMFNGGEYLVFISGTESNPLTVNTSIRFIVEGTGDEGSCCRVFLDDIFVYRVSPVLDEDIFALNGSRSGKDKISGGKANE